MREGSRLSICCLSALALFAAPVIAADSTWDGDTSTAWSDAGNWNPGVPANADRAIFPAALTPYLPTLDVNDTVQSLRFEKTDGGWTLGGSGNLLTIDPDNTVGAPLEDIAIEDLATTNGTTTIDTDINPTGFGPYIINLNGGTLWGNGTITPNANQWLTVNGGTASFARVGTSGGGRLSVNGTGRLELRGAQDGTVESDREVSHSGGLRLILGHKDAMGGGPYQPIGSSVLEATLDLTDANALTNGVIFRAQFAPAAHGFAGAYSITFTGALTPPSSGASVYIESSMDAGKKVMFTGDLDLNQRDYYCQGDGDIEFSGSLFGTGSRNDIVRSTGDGTLVLSGENTYSGDTRITDGTLQLTGSVLKSSDLIISGDGVLDLSTSGLIRVVQANYLESEADAEIAAGDIIGDSLKVSTFNDGGTDYTQIQATGGAPKGTTVLVR
jgi:autotransporter-associated beta strand protein